MTTWRINSNFRRLLAANGVDNVDFAVCVKTEKNPGKTFSASGFASRIRAKQPPLSQRLAEYFCEALIETGCAKPGITPSDFADAVPEPEDVASDPLYKAIVLALDARAAHPSDKKDLLQYLRLNKTEYAENAEEFVRGDCCAT